MTDWSKFDKAIDNEEISQAVADAKNNDFPEIPDGDYEVELENMEMKESKAGDPMLTAKFVIVEGEFDGSYVWYNGVMQPENAKAIGFQIHRNNIFLRALLDQAEDDDSRVKFTGFAQYADLIMDIAEEQAATEDEEGAAYLLNIKTDKKGFKQYSIIEALE